MTARNIRILLILLFFCSTPYLWQRFQVYKYPEGWRDSSGKLYKTDSWISVDARAAAIKCFALKARDTQLYLQSGIMPKYDINIVGDLINKCPVPLVINTLRVSNTDPLSQRGGIVCVSNGQCIDYGEEYPTDLSSLSEEERSILSPGEVNTLDFPMGNRVEASKSIPVVITGRGQMINIERRPKLKDDISKWQAFKPRVWLSQSAIGSHSIDWQKASRNQILAAGRLGILNYRMKILNPRHTVTFMASPRDCLVFIDKKSVNCDSKNAAAYKLNKGKLAVRNSKELFDVFGST